MALVAGKGTGLVSDVIEGSSIAGGAEEGESPREAARREAWEEAGIPEKAPFYALASLASVSVSHFAARVDWPKGLYVIPEYSFAVDATDAEIQLSEEHSEYAWRGYEEAAKRLHWHSNQVALWELAQQITDGRLGLPFS